jgi:class 3 adenylate cyclase
MPSERQQLDAAIAALQSQRMLLGDAIADAALAPLRARLAALDSDPAAGAATAGQALRQCTMLFLDVVNSTVLGRQLDAEDMHTAIDGALANFTSIVQDHGGDVLQYAGDSLLAVFGAGQAREDDAERAVHTGLALLAEGRRQRAQITQRHGLDGFDVRVGLHTGGVLLGGGVDAEGSIRGIAVHIAARMEQTAPAGGLRVSQDTYRQVRGVFDVEPQPPIDVKGLAAPVVTYLVQRVKPRAFRVATRGIEGVETRMVGRDAELAELQDAFMRRYEQGGLEIVLVSAEAGIGKSRLLYEFQNWAESRAEQFLLFQGRAHPQTPSQPYGLLRDILAWRMQITDGDTMDVARRKLEQGIAPLFVADDGDEMALAHAHLVGHLIGLDFADSPHVRGIRDDPRQIRNRGFHAAVQLLRRLAARERMPIVLLLDDLHWADDDSLDFLEHLVEVNRDVDMLVLGMTRPALFERRPQWSDSGVSAHLVELRPLGRASSRELADELLQRLPLVPAALRELLTGGAEGNPFYMEELLKMLVDEGGIQVAGDAWTVVPDRLLATRVPTTLVGVLQARIDGLPPAEKLALQQASVIGFVFWDRALAAVDERSVAALPAVTRRALVLPRPDADFEGMREFAFHHQLLHHVTYDTVLKRARREYHAKVAHWLAGLTGSRANDFLGATADHFEQAGDPTRAAEFFARAAEHASARYAQQAALDYAARAQALLGADDLAAHWRLLMVRERILDQQGRRTEQQTDIEALQRIAEALDEDGRRAQAAVRRSSLALRVADFETQAAFARQAIAFAERAGDAALALEAKYRLALALGNLGDAEAGTELAHTGLATARALGLRRAEGLFLNALSVIASQHDDLFSTLGLDQQTLPIDRELGDRPDEAITLSNLGVSWLKLGQYERARTDLEASLRLARMVGDRASEPYPLIALSRLALQIGDGVSALAHARAALEITFAVQEPVAESVASWSLGNAELVLGNPAAATEAFMRARAAALTTDSLPPHDATAGLARAALAQGHEAGALKMVEGLLLQLEGGRSLEGTEAPHLIRLTCWQVLQRCCDGRAVTVLAGAHTALQSRASTIGDAALRRSFLEAVPEHREIVAAWQANGWPADGDPGLAP